MRRENETFKEYKIRRAKDNLDLERKLMGEYVWMKHMGPLQGRIPKSIDSAPVWNFVELYVNDEKKHPELVKNWSNQAELLSYK